MYFLISSRRHTNTFVADGYGFFLFIEFYFNGEITLVRLSNSPIEASFLSF